MKSPLLAHVAWVALVVGQAAPAVAQPATQPEVRGGEDLVAQMMAQARSSPTFHAPPAGVKALPTDLFSSKNFYKEQAAWSDKRYYRCNTVRQLGDMHVSGRMPGDPAATAAWGDCAADLPREKIVSPYAYKTAKAHYEALLAAARAHGGPTVYTRATAPDWDGYYTRDNEADKGARWLWGTENQMPTILSLLTPEYQRRVVQSTYHEVVDASPQWNASFCYPEGLLRWWTQFSQGGSFQLTSTPAQVQMLSGIADNFVRQVMIGQEHVTKVPQWYGETVGFWDGETLVSWTANVQGWTLSHSMFEFSDKFETVEIFKPVKDASGKFVGIDHEAIFYDPEAFVQPLRATYRYIRRAPANSPTQRFTFIACLSNIKNTDGRPGQLTNTDPRYVDYYGRPWAQVWETWFEKGWDKPKTEAAPADVLDLFK